jgi:hypothetical protein
MDIIGLQFIEFFMDSVYILGLLSVLSAIFIKKSYKMRLRGLVALLGFLILPYIVATYTDFRPFFMMKVLDITNSIIQNTTTATNLIFSDFPTKLTKEDIQSLLVDSPFNNRLLDSLYYIGMISYAIIITLAVMITSAISSLLKAIWKLITKR